MPVGKLRQDYVPLPAARPQPQLTVNFEGMASAPSPARALQEQLERSHSAATAHDLEKWSPRKTLAFIVASSMALWMAVLVAGASVSHALA